MNVKWDITSACNLHCSHCCTGGQDYRSTPDMSLDEVRGLMASLRTSGITEVQFTGGEPFLRRDFPEVLALADEHFERVIVNTNGLLLRGRWLARERLARISTLIFSLDGPDRETHEAVRGPRTFERLLDNIRATVELRAREGLELELHLNAVLSRATLSRAADFIALADELGVDRFAINNAVETQNAKLHLNHFRVSWAEKYAFVEQMVNAAKGRRVNAVFEATPLGFAYINYKCDTRYRTSFLCGAGESGFYVQADGHVHPCMRATEDMSIRWAGMAPKLGTRTIEQARDSKYFRGFRKLAVYQQRGLEPCDSCKFVDHCSSCRFEYAASGKVEECVYINSALAEIVGRGANEAPIPP